MKTHLSILLQLVFLLLLSHVSFPQEVEVNLGGNTTSDAFIVKDSSGNALLRVDGDKNFGINSEQPNGIEIKGRSFTEGNVEGDPIMISGGSAYGTGGSVSLIGGSSENSGGGSVSLIGGVGTSGGEVVGGAIKILSGHGGDGGNIDIKTGGASSYLSGTINISTGDGNRSGDINIFTPSANAHAGSISLSTGYRGDITLAAKSSYGTVSLLASTGISLKTTNIQSDGYIRLETGDNDQGNNNIWLTVGNGGSDGDPRGIILDPNVGLVEIIGSGTYTGTWTQASDERYKNNIKPLLNLLNNVMLLQPVEYELNKEEFPENNFPDGKQVGLIAQEVEEVFPELVATNKDGYKSIDYSKISVLLLQSMKEQQNVIQKQAIEISEMKSDLEELKSLILQDANNLTSN